jgi:hypothetical protein
VRTPLDAFHQALVNLREERRRTEEGTVRRRRRVGVSEGVAIGTLVRVHIPKNLHKDQPHLVRFHGKIGTVSDTFMPLSLRPGGTTTAHVDLDGEWDPVSLPLTYLELVDPPPDGSNIEEIEAWLAS